MTTEAALLAAIAANPDDDLPRLVYADWLDENGQPIRAEFIRLQIEIAKKETLPRAAVNAFAYLWQRQQEILDGHKDELLGPLADTVRIHDFEFRRGFLERTTVDLAEFLKHQEYLGSLVPPPAVRVADDAFRIDALGTSSFLWLLTELCLCRDTWESQNQMTNQQLLNALQPIASQLSKVTNLEIENCRLGDAGILEFFRQPSFPALTDLDLSFNDLTDAGVIDLLNTGLPQRLKRLVLGGNPIGDQAAMELADRLGRSTVLETLNLRMTNIGQAGQAAITRAFGSRADLF